MRSWRTGSPSTCSSCCSCSRRSGSFNGARPSRRSSTRRVANRRKSRRLSTQRIPSPPCGPGWTEFNQQQHEHHDAAISWLSYIGNADFWEHTLENWQSEFLAVGSFAAFTIFLRQRGSPESKPVGAPHKATGIEG